jgi:uncharacterized protein (DUF2267 family)
MSQNYEAFVTTVQEEARVPFEDAERIARVVLGVLADRIAQGEARDLAAQLPAELAPHLSGSRDAVGFDAEEFVDRVAEAEGVDADTAERYAAAVFDAIGRTISDAEYDDLVAELSADYARLLPEGPDVRIVSYDAFVERVAEHAPADRETARRAADAVLEVLAQRIAGGEVEDLIRHLPRALHEPLRRGLQRSGGKARKLTLDGFLDAVAAAEGVDAITARDHVHGVLVALRDAVGDREFFDVTAQLPTDFQALLVR